MEYVEAMYREASWNTAEDTTEEDKVEEHIMVEIRSTGAEDTAAEAEDTTEDTFGNGSMCRFQGHHTIIPTTNKVRNSQCTHQAH